MDWPRVDALMINFALWAAIYCGIHIILGLLT
jgi:hypothetical protein